MSKQVRALRTSSAVEACATIDTDKTGGLHLLTSKPERLAIFDITAVAMAGSTSHGIERACIHNEVCQNYLRHFREENAYRFHRFTATQFMDVWNHYDTDGR